MNGEAFTALDYRSMSRALRLARRGRYTTRANPQVGCVLVKDGKVIGEGLHWRPGEGHAEVNALRNAGTLARGATAYVTLEPCCHEGRTPPCSQALIVAGVRKVIAAVTDPNPRVAGGGFKELRAAGIECFSGLLSAPAEKLMEAYLLRQRTGRPFVRLKLASSADGHTALANGESAWISGPASRLDVQRWRARAGAILTGVNTVACDNPSLTVRMMGSGESCASEISDLVQPLRVVIDGAARLSPDYKIFSTPGDVLLATRADPADDYVQAMRAVGADTLTLGSIGEHIDLVALLSELASRDINEVHCECGPNLGGALLEAKLVDELLLYTAPHLLGHGATPLVHLKALSSMAERTSLKIHEVTRIGDDLRVRLRPTI
jgi:diaminohydroxyphosphoribosylaminopyrimidine deaminase / 5-amino-6-(5-phosphoribosylamino)uracil reductase